MSAAIAGAQWCGSRVLMGGVSSANSTKLHSPPTTFPFQRIAQRRSASGPLKIDDYDEGMTQHSPTRTRIKSLDDRLARLGAERSRLMARASVSERKRDTGHKILMGGAVPAAVQHEGVSPYWTSTSNGRMTTPCSTSRRRCHWQRRGRNAEGATDARYGRASLRRPGGRRLPAIGALWRFCETPRALWPA
jgi:hypothetical protein